MFHSTLSQFGASFESRSSSRQSSISTPHSRINVGERYKFICAIAENRMREVVKIYIFIFQ